MDAMILSSFLSEHGEPKTKLFFLATGNFKKEKDRLSMEGHVD